MRRGRRVRRAIGVAVLVGLSGGAASWATLDNFKSYKAAYPGKDPKLATCKVCHEHPIGKATDLNAYGKALQQFKGEPGAKKLTAEDYQAFDAADTDADGATNAQELNTGTDPLNPASAPSAPPSK